MKNLNEMYLSILDGYENSKIVTAVELGKSNGTINYCDLPDKKVEGVLKANYIEDGVLKQIYSEKDNHVCVIAATRQGKTTSYVIPSILSYARQKEKRHMIITDPKGEIYKTTAKTIESNGYNIKLINFRNSEHSEYWNPLTPIYRKYEQCRNAAEEAVTPYGEDENCWMFRGSIYRGNDGLTAARRNAMDYYMPEADKDVDDFVNQIITVENDRDPSWEYGARDIVKGIIYGMLEDTEYSKNRITEKNFSLDTLIKIAGSLGSNESGSRDNGYFSNRSTNSRAYKLVKPYLKDTARATCSSYLAVMMAKFTEYQEETVRRITACNSFEFSDFTIDDKPTVLFIDFRDELDAHYNIINLFIQTLYTYLIEYANNSKEGRLKTGVRFILDEFGNMPKLKSFKRVISAAGGRNIWFTVIIQSYAQLKSVYGEDADIIRDNLNVHIFMGSNNPDTLEEFSRECGKTTRFSPLCALNGRNGRIDDFTIETVSAMPVSRLACLKKGECIVTEVNCGYVMLTMLERYFECKELNCLPIAGETEYICPVNIYDSKYNYVLKGRYRMWE